LTGRAGVGKSSVILRVVNSLRGDGYKLGGMVSREVREKGVRVGFRVEDIQSDKWGWLAQVDRSAGPRVGKYRVDLKGLEIVGVKGILRAVEESDVIVVDEIGPMELFSSGFKDAVKRGISSGKPMLGTVHFRSRDPLIRTIKSHGASEIIEVTLNNRDRVHSKVASKIMKVLDV
jgi:nucleoside-triphosphatase